MRTVLIAMLLTQQAGAGVIYDSGINNQTPPQAGVILGNGTTVANSFALAGSATLRSVSIFTLECCGNTWNGTINYEIFTNNGSIPSSVPIAQGNSVAYVRAPIYSDGSNVIERNDFNLTIPISLNAGVNYWLAVAFGGSTVGNEPGWNLLVPFSGLSARSANSTFDNWTNLIGTGAFTLQDTAFLLTVPESGSAGFLLGGFVLLVLRFRKKGNGRFHHAVVKWGGDNRRAADHGVAASVEVR